MFFLLYRHTDETDFDDFPKISDHFPSPGCGFVWILRVMYFPIKQLCLCNKYTSVFHASVLLLIVNFVITSSNCSLSLVDASHINSCVCPLISWQYTWANKRARIHTVIVKVILAIVFTRAAPAFEDLFNTWIWFLLAINTVHTTVKKDTFEYLLKLTFI